MKFVHYSDFMLCIWLGLEATWRVSRNSFGIHHAEYDINEFILLKPTMAITTGGGRFYNDQDVLLVEPR